MRRTTGGIPISDFLEFDDPTLGYFPFVEHGVNYKIPYSQMVNWFGAQLTNYGLSDMQGNSTATTIASISVPVAVSGAFSSAFAENFTWTSGSKLTYGGLDSRTFTVSADITVQPSSSTNKAISVYIAQDGVVIANSRMEAVVSTALPVQIHTEFFVLMGTGSYIEIFVQNATDTTSVLVSRAILKANG